MISLWTRANAVFFYSLSVLLCLACGSALTALLLDATPVVRVLGVHKVLTLRPQQESLKRSAQDRAILTFNLDAGASLPVSPSTACWSQQALSTPPPNPRCPADLTGIFNWNVKQLFVYISATYATKTNSFNEVVIWDKVISSPEGAKLLLTEQYNKYPLVDQKADLRDTPITLSLFWDVMPITGILKRSSKRMTRVRLPAAYCRDTPNPAEDECEYTLLPLDDPPGGAAASSSSSGGGSGSKEKIKAWDEL